MQNNFFCKIDFGEKKIFPLKIQVKKNDLRKRIFLIERNEMEQNTRKQLKFVATGCGLKNDSMLNQSILNNNNVPMLELTIVPLVQPLEKSVIRLEEECVLIHLSILGINFLGMLLSCWSQVGLSSLHNLPCFLVQGSTPLWFPPPFYQQCRGDVKAVMSSVLEYYTPYM